MSTSPAPVEIVVDSANVMGSRPDGWWRDRAAAATRLVQALAALPGTLVPAPDGAVVGDGPGDGPLARGRAQLPAAAVPAGVPAAQVASVVGSGAIGPGAVGSAPVGSAPADVPRGEKAGPASDGSLQSPHPVHGHGRVSLQVERVVAVVEGQARQIPQVSGVSLVRATADGDGAVVEACTSVLAAGGVPVAVTADRGLRARLPEGTVVAGPRWLLQALDGQSRNVGSAGGISTSI